MRSDSLGLVLPVRANVGNHKCNVPSNGWVFMGQYGVHGDGWGMNRVRASRYLEDHFKKIIEK